MKKQKFKKGDLVRVAKDLGKGMSHFQNDCNAIVMYSYNDKYGGGDTENYSLYLQGHGKCSWYCEHQLTLIEADRLDKLKEWKDAKKAEIKVKSDIDWIFNHGDEVLANPSGASVQTLASCLGCTNLWGSRGEGFTYHLNAIATLRLAEPYLKTKDKQGWLDFCRKIEDQ